MRLFSLDCVSHTDGASVLAELCPSSHDGRCVAAEGLAKPPAEVHIKAALGLLLGRMMLCHKIEGLAAKKGVGERTSVRPGKPPPLHVTTVTRKNHNLTLITGLENYGPSHLLLAAAS